MKFFTFFVRNYIARNFVDLLPKLPWVAIQTYPDWEDNGLALYEKLNRTKIKKVIWLTCQARSDFPLEMSIDTIFVKRRSFKGFFLSSFCKYVFITHGTYFDVFPRRQISVNVWHGFGFKAVGLLNNMIGLTTTYLLATSSFSKRLMAMQMGMAEERVFSFGFPRNDRMLEAKSRYKELRRTLGFDGIESKKLIVWMPTYRRSGEGDIRIDGKDFSNPFNLDEFDLNDFSNFCKERDIVCLFRIHPMAVAKVLNVNCESVVFVNDDWLSQKRISLYQLLGITDLLISDLSSVITDYLLLDNPIIHAFSDLESYLASRPLLLNPPSSYWVGPLVESQDRLEDELLRILEDGFIDLRFKSIREEFRSKFFDHSDSQSTDRLCRFLNINRD